MPRPTAAHARPHPKTGQTPPCYPHVCTPHSRIVLEEGHLRAKGGVDVIQRVVGADEHAGQRVDRERERTAGHLDTLKFSRGADVALSPGERSDTTASRGTRS